MFFILTSPAGQPRWAQAAVRSGQAAVTGAPALVAWTLPQRVTPWPQLHSARSGTLGTHYGSGHPLGFQRKNNIFICQ